jgi:hypothetical protein
MDEQTYSKSGFCLHKYCVLLDITIRNILLRKEKDVLTYDILDTEKSTTNKLIILKEKQRQMKVGDMARGIRQLQGLC